MKYENEIKNLEIWKNELEPVSLKEILSFGVSKVAFLSIDLIEGFCAHGALSSPRYAEVVAKTAKLFEAAYKNGAKHLLLIQDRHSEQSTEFKAFAKHALIGSSEAEAVKELKRLAFFDELKPIYKNSLSVGYAPNFKQFLADNPGVQIFVLLGVCTDLCVYSAASYLALSANEQNLNRRIIVPANLVQTYDAPNHDGDLYQLIFLNHMAQAFGAQIVSEILI